jgi:hypothetical protein
MFWAQLCDLLEKAGGGRGEGEEGQEQEQGERKELKKRAYSPTLMCVNTYF